MTHVIYPKFYQEFIQNAFMTLQALQEDLVYFDDDMLYEYCEQEIKFSCRNMTHVIHDGLFLVKKAQKWSLKRSTIRNELKNKCKTSNCLVLDTKHYILKTLFFHFSPKNMPQKVSKFFFLIFFKNILLQYHILVLYVIFQPNPSKNKKLIALEYPWPVSDGKNFPALHRQSCSQVIFLKFDIIYITISEKLKSLKSFRCN